MLPFLKSDIPSDSHIFCTLLVPEIKSTEIPNIFECHIRECIIGNPQKWFLDFDNAYAPIAESNTIHAQIAWTAANGYFVVVLDIKNAFQNTIALEENRIFVTVPPLYMEWLQKKEGFVYDPSQQYLRVMLNANQGT